MEAKVISKVSRRIVPFVALCYFLCYLDRVNVGFAAADEPGSRVHCDYVRVGRGDLLFWIFLL